MQRRVRLPAKPRSVADARRLVLAVLDEAGSESYDAVLLTSELASNVVQHAGTEFEVRVEVDDDHVRVEMKDGVAVSQAFRELIEHHPGSPAHLDARGGRGLLLLTRVAARCGLEDHADDGKTVWFEVPVNR